MCWFGLCAWYQLVLVTYDPLRASNRATATVSISVNRNPNAPFVLDGVTSMDELTPAGDTVFNVSAFDSDGVRIHFIDSHDAVRCLPIIT